jgi:hypothetical protein
MPLPRHHTIANRGCRNELVEHDCLGAEAIVKGQSKRPKLGTLGFGGGAVLLDLLLVLLVELVAWVQPAEVRVGAVDVGEAWGDGEVHDEVAASVEGGKLGYGTVV